ncbi:HPr-rel-A system PqqD family peptide chaperone [Sediminicurvatus halobius]|uniref:HPr-rel-A system PqqD family peptide chaperone n=1 Tax=Sediminicurvatus halobius TaxID=2182432 RepID=UPI001304D7DA|nr:HPr-rel-A system PqqD family peptide chaperone [Spiribacter halobius]UEX77240.1 HPr-rel-A system PqqD family peptide chaperone [Spiribacter halobius]
MQDSATTPLTLSPGCRWRTWEGESVLYDTRSDATHYLNAFSTQVLHCIEQGIAEPDAITRRVRSALGLRAWVATQRDVHRALAELWIAGIIIAAEAEKDAP